MKEKRNGYVDGNPYGEEASSTGGLCQRTARGAAAAEEETAEAAASQVAVLISWVVK